MKKYLKKYNKLDDVSRFRLLNAFIFAIGFNILIPVLVDLKGEYLVAWAISLFMIGEQLIVKTNRFMSKFSLSTLYKMGATSHVLLIIAAGFYFIDPMVMIIADSLISIVLIGIFGAYSIRLNTHLTDNYPDSMTEFQIIRNGTWADGILIGLSISTFISYFFDNGTGIIVFMIYNALFNLWMICNWRFYDKRGL